MAAWPALATQVDALDLDLAVRAPVLFVRGRCSSRRVGINIRQACNCSGSTFVLLRVGLSAACSLHNPIADYDAVLRIDSLFSRGIAGTKDASKGSEERLWY